jgi:tungstate transport system substrate-binding protein
MGAALSVASEKAGYTLTDRGTFLALRKRLALTVVFENARPLLNLYHVMLPDPGRFPRVNHEGGQAFADFLVAPATQRTIERFGVESFGQSLFVPAAGRPESQLAGEGEDD